MSQTYSSVGLCNIALGLLSEKAIVSFDEGTTRASLCNLFYPMARDIALEKVRPNFAKTEVALNAAASSSSVDWDFEYPLPPDYITMVSTIPEDIKYEIRGTSIFSDEDSLYIVYIKRETNTAVFTPSFAYAVALKLAGMLAPTLKGDMQISQAFEQQFLIQAEQAATFDSKEEPPREIKADDFDVVRPI